MDHDDRPTPSTDGSPDSASLSIRATPDRLYALVTDVANMGRLSPECIGGRWLDGATGPAVGARFRGANRRGWVRWWTVNTVVAADPGREFAFETRDSGIRWRYRFTADGDGAVAQESREAFADRPLRARAFSRFLLGGIEEHDEEMRAGLVATLERLKAVAEA